MKHRSIITIKDIDPKGPIAKMVYPRPMWERMQETRFTQNWKSAYRQRGSIGHSVSVIASSRGVDPNAPNIVITGETITFSEEVATCYSGIRWNPDGSIDKQGSTIVTFNQIDAGEYWSDEPESNIGASYDVRALSGGTGSWNSSAASDNTWIQMNAERIWHVLVLSKDAPDSASATRTFEIRSTGSGSAIDSASYTCNASVGF